MTSCFVKATHRLEDVRYIDVDLGSAAAVADRLQHIRHPVIGLQLRARAATDTPVLQLLRWCSHLIPDTHTQPGRSPVQNQGG